MPSNGPPVPSKNALRALRRLALTGSTAIGTLGSFCGLVLVSYDVRQRIRLAEKIVENKRIIRSVSNGAGKAHLARMFELAENGEQFGLDPTKQDRRRRSRKYVTFASGHVQDADLEDVGDVRDAVQAISDLTQRKRTGDDSTRIVSSGSPSPTLDRKAEISLNEKSSKAITPPTTNSATTLRNGNQELDATRLLRRQQPSHFSYASMHPIGASPTIKTPGETKKLAGSQQNSSAAQRIVEATQKQHKVATLTVHGRPANANNSTRSSLAGCVDMWLTSELQSGKQHPKHKEKPGLAPSSAHATSDLDGAPRIPVVPHGQLSEAKVRRILKGNGTTPISSPVRHGGLIKLRQIDRKKDSGQGETRSSFHTTAIEGQESPERQIQRFPGRTINVSLLGSSFSPWPNASHAAPLEDLQPQQGTKVETSLKSGSKWNLVASLPSDNQHMDDQVISYTDHEPFKISTSEVEPRLQEESSCELVQQEAFDTASKIQHLLSRIAEDQVRESGLTRYQEVVRYAEQSPSDLSDLSSDMSSNFTDLDPLRHVGSQPIGHSRKIHADEKHVLYNPNAAMALKLSPCDQRDSSPDNTRVRSFTNTSDEQDGIKRRHPLSDHKRWHLTAKQQSVNVYGQPFSTLVSHQGDLENEDNFRDEREDFLVSSPKILEMQLAESPHSEIIVAISTLIDGGMKAKAQQYFEDALTTYANSGTAKDWKRVDNLRVIFKELMGPKSSATVRRLARFLLGNATNCRELWPESQEDPYRYFLYKTAAILFPRKYQAAVEGQSMIQHSRRLYYVARQYLAEAWADGHDADQLIRELHNVIRAARLLQLPIVEEPFATVLRLLAGSGEVHKACALLEEMEQHHKIKSTMLTKTAVLEALAKARDWDSVSKHFERMHFHGLSRSKPLGYAVMFNKILRHYAIQKSPVEVYEFAVNALCYWGVVPAGGVSATVISTCLEHERYDLVREWVEGTRMSFPRVDPGTFALALSLSDIWSQPKTSCEQIEKACKAIIADADGSDQHDAFKAAVRDSMKRILSENLKILGNDPQIMGDDLEDPESLTLEECISRATRLIDDVSKGDGLMTPKVQNLLKEMNAIGRVSQLLGGKSICASNLPKPHTEDEHESHYRRPKPLTARFGGLQTTFPAALTTDELPRLPEIHRLVDEYYTTRAKEELPPHHLLLKYVCERLQQHARTYDAYSLINHIYHSEHVQGSRGLKFGIDLTQLWVQLVLSLKSLQKSLPVLWAVLDMSNDLQLTEAFVLLVRMTVRKLSATRFRDATPTEEKELSFILQSLQNRLDYQKKRVRPPR